MFAKQCLLSNMSHDGSISYTASSKECSMSIAPAIYVDKWTNDKNATVSLRYLNIYINNEFFI